MSIQLIVKAGVGKDSLSTGADKINANFLEISTGGSVIPAWVKVGSLTFASFAAAALVNSINLFLLGAGQIIHGAKIKHSAAFTGGGVSAYSVSVGVVGDVQKYASAFNVFQAPGGRVYQLSANFGAESHSAATQITATATSVGANLSAASAGAIEIWAMLSTAV